MVEKWTVTQGTISTKENDSAVQVDGVNLVDPIYIHTLDDNQTIRVHFTDLVQYDAKIFGTNGTGKFTYTTPIQPNDTGAVNSASAQVRKNGTVKLTLTPSANCVGTAEEIKSELQKAAPNAVVSVTEKDGSFEAGYPQRNRQLWRSTPTICSTKLTQLRPARPKTAAFPLLRHAPRLATR